MVYHLVEFLGLLNVQVVPCLLDVVNLHKRGRASLLQLSARATVQPRSRAVDEGHGAGGREVSDQTGKHRPHGPAVLELHGEERLLTSAEGEKSIHI